VKDELGSLVTTIVEKNVLHIILRSWFQEHLVTVDLDVLGLV
jgi:hypothetical protein